MAAPLGVDEIVKLIVLDVGALMVTLDVVVPPVEVVPTPVWVVVLFTVLL
jgi:hypothetical protein